MKYRIETNGRKTKIKVSEVGDGKDRLKEAFAECQEGRCSCPTAEYGKVASMEVSDEGDGVTLSLETKPGEVLDEASVRRCLDHTADKLSKQ